MASRAVQISLDQDLLSRIDRDPETRKLGRSAFIRSAVSTYLLAKERRKLDDAIRKAYRGKSNELLAEVEQLLGTQAWPES